MSRNLHPLQPTDPLSPGNAVSASLRLDRDRFQQYFWIAVRATLWALLPFLVLIPIALLLISGEANPSTWLLLIPIGILLLFYGTTKYIANSALISRLTFNELIDRPETTQEARHHVDPKFWLFFRTYILFSLLTFGIIIGFYLVVILLGIIGGVIGSVFRDNIPVIVVLVLAGVILFAVLLSFLIRIFTRLFMFEVPLAIEDNINASQTIQRSWSLTKGYVGRVFLILTVGFLVSIPIYIVVQIAVTLLQGIILNILATERTSIEFQVASFIIAYILGLISGAVLLPFWQALKGVIYYDLRSRREGLDLQLRDSMFE